MAHAIAAQASRGLTRQKLILGDWSRVVRDPLDVFRLAFIAAAIGWGLAGRPVTVVIAASAALVFARIVSLPRFYDMSLLVVMFLIAWGEDLRLYDSWSSYDKVVHFTVPLLATGMIYVLLVRLGILPELRDLKQPHQRFGFGLTVVALGMAFGAGWEIVEWTLDSTTGSHLQINARDTATDLIADTLGALGSAIILVLWSLGGHSLKRRPGAALADHKLTSFLTIRAAAR